MNRPDQPTRRALLASALAAGGSLLLPGLGALTHADDTGSSSGESTDLLILGAGPFGLALAAWARESGIDHRVVGVPMGFWRDNMPEGMLLRSSCDWSLDPLGVHTIDRYLETLGKRCAGVEPLSRAFYLDYAGWFQERKAIASEQRTVTGLNRGPAGLVARFADGGALDCRNVVLAIGFAPFAHTPPDLAAHFPADRHEHTCSLVDFRRLRGRRVLIIGGRQSAFEWTALIREAGADAVHVAYRHDTPRFETAHWNWVNDIVDRMSSDPGWYRRLNEEEKAAINRRFWEEGRLKLEPWLAPRIDHDNVRLHPRTNVSGADVGDHGIRVTLDDGERLTVDHVVFATGYRVDLARVSCLTGLLPALEIRDGYAPLDTGFQSPVPGLFITSLPATRDFGSFFAFTVSVRAQAQIIGHRIRERLAGTERAVASRTAARPHGYRS